MVPYSLDFLTALTEAAFENIEGKGENAKLSLCGKRFNPLPNGKILDWSKLKTFADDKINVAEITISLSDGVENIVGKGENAGYFFPRVVKRWDCVVKS